MNSDLSNDLTTVLPAWVIWAGPILALITFALATLLARVVVVEGSLRSARRQAHWTEKARHVHVARMGSVLSVIVLPGLALLFATAFVGPLAAMPRWAVTLVLAAGGILVALLSSAAVEREVHGPPEGGLLRAGLGMLFGYAPVALLLGLGWFAPSELTSWLMVPWLATVFATVYAWLRAPLLMTATPFAEPAGERASAVVARASQSLSTSVDRVLEFRGRQPNAFAFPWLGVVAFTTGLLDALDDDELEAITHHELAHLAESPWLTRLRKAQLYALVPIVATRPLFGSIGIAGPILAVLLFAAVTEIVRRRGLAAERASDAAAVESIHQSAVFGHALEKTYRIGMIPAVLRRATHGQLHERIEAAGLEPDFEPPAPPPRVRPWIAAVGVFVVLVAGWFSPWIVYAFADDASFGPTHLAATLPVYGSDSLESLAIEAEFADDWSDAAILYEAAAEVRPDNSFARLEAVRSWAYAGDCDRAASAADRFDPETPAEDLALARELVDWCEVWGGLPTSG